MALVPDGLAYLFSTPARRHFCSEWGLHSQAYRLLRTENRQLLAAARLSTELRDYSETAIAPAGVDPQQQSQHSHRLGLATDAIWRFLATAETIFGVKMQSQALLPGGTP